jgi:pSer/pThr/pTyr-binding forkhead associated (FHA) protein
MDKTIVSPESGTAAAEPTAFLSSAADVTQAAIAFTCPVCRTQNPPGERWCRDCGFLLGSTVEGPLEMPEPVAGPRLIGDGGREFPLRAGANTVGRENADILLLDPTVSRRHAQIVLEDGAAFVEDLGSTNGTRIDGAPVPIGERSSIAEGSELRFGSVALRLALGDAASVGGAGAPTSDLTARSDLSEGEPQVPDDRPAVALLVAADGTEYPFREGVTTAGRRAGNDIVLTGDPYLSGRHAQFRIDAAGWTVIDLGSTNGTFVNGERLREGQPQPLAAGDEVRLGQTVFVVQPAAGGEDVAEDHEEASEIEEASTDEVEG